MIDDIVIALEADPSLRDNPAMMLRQFFAKLGGELPAEVNAPAVHLKMMWRASGAS